MGSPLNEVLSDFFIKIKISTHFSLAVSFHSLARRLSRGTGGCGKSFWRIWIFLHFSPHNKLNFFCSSLLKEMFFNWEAKKARIVTRKLREKFAFSGLRGNESIFQYREQKNDSKSNLFTAIDSGEQSSARQRGGRGEDVKVGIKQRYAIKFTYSIRKETSKWKENFYILSWAYEHHVTKFFNLNFLSSTPHPTLLLDK